MHWCRFRMSWYINPIWYYFWKFVSVYKLQWYHCWMSKSCLQDTGQCLIKPSSEWSVAITRMSYNYYRPLIFGMMPLTRKEGSCTFQFCKMASIPLFNNKKRIYWKVRPWFIIKSICIMSNPGENILIDVHIKQH